MEAQPPQWEQHPTYKDEFDVTHPAYGVVQVSRTSGGSRALFMSEIGHDHRICLRVHKAKHRRHLNNYWTHAGEKLIEVEMSELQFAQMISSMNLGSGVPCTLRVVPSGDLERMPDIVPDAQSAVFSMEIKKAAAKAVADATNAHALLHELMQRKTVKKSDLKPINDCLYRLSTLLPSNMRFIQDQFQEAMEHTTEQAKAQAEGHVLRVLQQAGLAKLKEENHEGKSLGVHESPALGDASSGAGGV